MSTVLEIEAAIKALPLSERERLEEDWRSFCRNCMAILFGSGSLTTSDPELRSQFSATRLRRNSKPTRAFQESKMVLAFDYEH